MKQYLLLSLTFAFVVLTPLAAGAAGDIKGITLTPTTVAAGGTVIIQLKGQETCGALNLVFGDGQQVSLTNISFPYSTTHPYTKTGTLTVTASGVTNCRGSKSAQLMVNPGTAAPPPGGGGTGSVARQLGAARMQLGTRTVAAALSPKINAVLPFSQISPGGTVIIGGVNFGPAPGKFVLVGDFPARRLELQLHAGAQGWGDDHAAGIIPSGCVLGEYQAWLQIERGDGWKSDGWPVTFRGSAIQGREPNAGEIRISCNPNGGRNECQPWSTGTVRGTHEWPRPGGPPVLAGIDGYKMTLRACERLRQPEIKYQEGTVSTYTTGPDGYGEASVWVNWSYPNQDKAKAAYGLYIGIDGPAAR